MNSVSSNGRKARTPSTALVVLLILVAGGWGVSSSSSTDDTSVSDDGSNTSSQGTCFDGIDNDGDGFIDAEDPSCDDLSPSYDGDEV